MKLGLVLSVSDPETAFNVLRLGNFALSEGDEVKLFLLGKGVELDRIEDPKFSAREQAEAFVGAGGRILACGTCLKLRDSEGSELCPLSTMKDLHDLIKQSDKVLAF